MTLSLSQQILIGTLALVLVVLLLSVVVLLARAFLVKGGQALLNLNGGLKTLSVPLGGKLSSTLSQSGIFLSTACGGKGSCGECRCIVKKGGGGVLPVEETHLSKPQLSEGWRLACQVRVRDDLEIEVPSSVLGVKSWQCKVLSNANVATFIKELCLEIPKGQEVPFRAGGYVQLEAPAHQVHYKDFDIEPQYRADWERMNLFALSSEASEGVARAYSMANHPGEKGVLKFNIRVATPPKPGVPPGVMSSYVFSLKPGDTIRALGPFGEFFVRETPREKIFIGGGAGMAPLRSQIFEELSGKNSVVKISYWYGARSLKELFYDEDFKAIETAHPNFSWHVALSNPQPEDDWKGSSGFIHQVVYREYLRDHEAPEECEYYLCGPPMMIQSVMVMLRELGVDRKDIFFDDFGS